MADSKRALQPLTLADLCEAIADGHIAYTVDQENYVVKGVEARRLGREHHKPLIDAGMLLDAAPMDLELGCSA